MGVPPYLVCDHKGGPLRGRPYDSPGGASKRSSSRPVKFR